MAEQQASIHHISDTARWVAVYRAEESERQDAHFHDPFARRLAGERGEEIAKSVSFNRWVVIARTWLIDQLIEQQVENGIGMVVNLAAGLDTRPYRMALPKSLIWVEVDLPDILDYKEEILDGAAPVCRLERIRCDLSDVNARRALLHKIGERADKALVITEGLLIYLTADQVGALATDLAAVRSFRNWIADIQSPDILKIVNKQMAGQIREGAATFQFGPADGPRFFTAYGWTPVEVHSQLKAAARLKRLPFLVRLVAMLPEKPPPKSTRPWSAVCLLENEASA